MPDKYVIVIDPQPVLGDGEWHVRAWHPSGTVERIAGFKTKEDARAWIANEAAAWRRARGDDVTEARCAERFNRTRKEDEDRRGRDRRAQRRSELPGESRAQTRPSGDVQPSLTRS